MKIACVQHDDLGGLGNVATWMTAHPEIQFDVYRLHEGAKLPLVDNVDALILMGGALNPNDEESTAWLKTEKRFVLEYLELEKPVLGICFGAQLLANVLGAKVARMHEKEVGWLPLRPEARIPASPFNGEWSDFVSFHLHRDQFETPTGAICLLSSELCQDQAFIYRKRVLGLQFHPEANAEVLDSYLAHGLIHMTSENEVALLKNVEQLKKNYQLMSQILNWLTR